MMHVSRQYAGGSGRHLAPGRLVPDRLTLREQIAATSEDPDVDCTLLLSSGKGQPSQLSCERQLDISERAFQRELLGPCHFTLDKYCTYCGKIVHYPHLGEYSRLKRCITT